MLDRPSDLRYLESLNIGFLAREDVSIVLQNHETEGYVVFESLRPAQGQRAAVLEHVVDIASVAHALRGVVESFWAMGYREEAEDPTIVLFQRFCSRDGYISRFVTNTELRAARFALTSLQFYNGDTPS